MTIWTEENVEELVVAQEDTLIHIEGIPFWLPAGSEIIGNPANLNLVHANLQTKE